MWDRYGEELRKSLESEYSMGDHPKAELLWRLAWDYGHSDGDYIVTSYYEDLLELLK